MKTLTAAARADVERFLERSTGYVVLRNHDIWANLAQGGDVDLLVADADEAEKVMFLCLGNPLWTARRSYVRQYFYFWGHIDLLPSLEWHGAVYLPNPQVFEAAEQSHLGFLKPRLAHEALVSWFSSLLWGGFFKERYRATILEAVQEDGVAFRQALIHAAGRRWGERLWQMAVEGRPEISAQCTRAIRRAVLWQSFRRNPSVTLTRWLAFWTAEIRLRLRPPVPWVAVLGPDGSGKSSLVDALSSRLAPAFVGMSRHHWRPGFVRPPADNSPVPDPHGKPLRGRFTSLLKLGFLFSDWILGYWGRLVHLRAKGCLVLFDRDYYDLLVDFKRYRYKGPLWLARYLGKIIPRPDLIVLLDAPPEVFHARKQEVPFDETVRQREQYLKLACGLPNGHVVDVSRPLGEVGAEVEKIVLNHVSKYTARRLTLYRGRA